MPNEQKKNTPSIVFNLVYFYCWTLNVIFLYFHSVSISKDLFLIRGFLLGFPLQLRASHAHAIWSPFFSCPVQLCNYFHCALPVESSPKLHVSRCGKYMTFGAASPRENNEKNCAMPVAHCFFFFFLFVRLCVCFSFLAEQKLLSSPNFAEHFWRRLEQPLITCG